MEIEYNENIEELLKEPEFTTLKQIKITNIPLTKNATQLFQNKVFIEKLNNLTSLHTVNLIVKEDINENRLQILLDTCIKKKLLITINSNEKELKVNKQSNNSKGKIDCHIFWKMEGIEKKFESLIFDGTNLTLNNFITTFLTDSLLNNHNGNFKQNFISFINFDIIFSLHVWCKSFIK